MTSEELDEQIERAVGLFGSIPNLDPALIDRFVEQGFLSFDDLSIMDPEELAQLEGLDVVKAKEIVDFAEVEAERAPKEKPARSRAEAAIERAGEPESEPTAPEAPAPSDDGSSVPGGGEVVDAAAPASEPTPGTGNEPIGETSDDNTKSE
jgi:N utilization substance protein A